MDPLVCSFNIPYRFSVHFTRGAFACSNSLFGGILRDNGFRRVLLLVEQAVANGNPALLGAAEDYLKAAGIPHSVHVLPGGESVKENDFAVKRLYGIIEAEGLCRHSCVAAVGGGAFLDVAGFAAATMHRGIGHIRFPSTLLAQADAGVGVKNGINFAGKKNLVGTFAPPLAVINDSGLLATLDPVEMRAGLSEAVKVALIRDPAFFEWIETAAPLLRDGSPAEIEELVGRCAALHVNHIATGGDPFERGSQRPLDFGHWAAHKLEQMSGFRLRHGQAVSIGIALDSVYAAKAGDLAEPDLERILALLENLGLPTFNDELLNTDSLLRGLDEFREHLGGDLCVTLVHGIGSAREVNVLDHKLIRQSIAALHARNKT